MEKFYFQLKLITRYLRSKLFTCSLRETFISMKKTSGCTTHVQLSLSYAVSARMYCMHAFICQQLGSPLWTTDGNAAIESSMHFANRMRTVLNRYIFNSRCDGSGVRVIFFLFLSFDSSLLSFSLSLFSVTDPFSQLKIKSPMRRNWFLSQTSSYLRRKTKQYWFLFLYFFRKRRSFFPRSL